MCTVGPRVSNSAFYIFPLTPHVKILKCHKIFKAWPIAKKIRSSISQIIESEILQSAPHDPKTKLKESGIKSTLCAPSHKVSSISLFNQSFSRYCIFQDFPIDSHVKISKYLKIFKFWQINNIYHNFCSFLTTLFIIKFGSEPMKT